MTNGDNQPAENPTNSCSNCSQLQEQTDRLQVELNCTKVDLKYANSELERRTKELNKIKPERNRLDIERLKLIADKEHLISELNKEKREAQSSAGAALTWQTRCEQAEEENQQLKHQIINLKYGVGSTLNSEPVPTTSNQLEQGTVPSSDNNNSLNRIHATFFGIGAIIGFAILGLGQIIFGKMKENEIKELREKLQKTKNELLLAQSKLKNWEEKEVGEK